MMKTRTLQSIILALLLILPVLVSAQAPGGQIIRRKPTITKQIKPSKPVKQVKPTSPATGTLSIISTPADAAIKIDGKYVGNSPLILEKQKVGNYQVTFSAEGYESQTQSVSVTAGKTVTCSTTLKKKQASQPVVQQQEQKPAPSSSPASKTFTVNGVSFTMVKVEAGTFTMGATSEQGTSNPYDDEKPAHKVTLTKDYYIGQTEVTQALWQAVMGNNPSEFKGDNLPVECVSWDDSQTFITKLNSLTGSKFRLPTEAEWEYAARGGNKSQGYKYSGSNSINDVAWYTSTTNDSGTKPVATKAPNELGIYDMSGNVWEWCYDWYGSYSSSAQTDPTGATSGSFRVNRGGGWSRYARHCRVSYRDNGSPGNRSNNLGLRLAL